MKKLGFGLMRLPQTDPDNAESIDFDAVCKMVDTFLERGFTYFDTAYNAYKYKYRSVIAYFKSNKLSCNSSADISAH